jgi:hypothetical protein
MHIDATVCSEDRHARVDTMGAMLEKLPQRLWESARTMFKRPALRSTNTSDPGVNRQHTSGDIFTDTVVKLKCARACDSLSLNTNRI